MRWKPIPRTADSYSASDTGQIRRDKSVCGNHNARPGMVMAQTKDKYGYSQTCLCFDGRQRTVTVHRLVALAFIGEPPRGKPQINHKNGRKDDNRPSNLEWCTVKHNIRHALAMGLKIPQNGSAIGNSKLMESQVLDIKSRTIKRGDQCRIAKEFGISEASVSLILSGGTWSHISP